MLSERRPRLFFFLILKIHLHNKDEKRKRGRYWNLFNPNSPLKKKERKKLIYRLLHCRRLTSSRKSSWLFHSLQLSHRPTLNRFTTYMMVFNSIKNRKNSSFPVKPLSRCPEAVRKISPSVCSYSRLLSRSEVSLQEKKAKSLNSNSHW